MGNNVTNLCAACYESYQFICGHVNETRAFGDLDEVDGDFWHVGGLGYFQRDVEAPLSSEGELESKLVHLRQVSHSVFEWLQNITFTN